MQNHRLLVLFGSLLAVSCGFSGVCARASTPFAITATNVTMPTSGISHSTFTITSIPAAGTITVSCIYAGTNAEAKVPYCGGGPVLEYQVTAGETLTKSITIYPYGEAVPAASLQAGPHRSGHLPAAGLVLSGALMLGFSFWRRARRWLTLAVLALGTLAGLAGISCCGGNGNGAAHGTFPYVVTADFIETGTSVIQPVTTTISITVP
jgi:hypothetical protein